MKLNPTLKENCAINFFVNKNLFIKFIIALWQVCQGSASNQCLQPNAQM